MGGWNRVTAQLSDLMIRRAEQKQRRTIADSKHSGNGMGQHYTHPNHPVVQRAVALAKETKAADVLDIGTGRGIVATTMSKRLKDSNPNLKIVATDIGEVGLGELRQTADHKGYPIDTAVMDAAKPLPEAYQNRFDLVVVKDVLPFLQPAGVMQLFKNIAQALRPGGWFIVTAPSTRSALYANNSPVHPGGDLYRTLSDSDKAFIQTDRDAFFFESVLTVASRANSYGLAVTEAKHYGRANGWLWAIGQKKDSP